METLKVLSAAVAAYRHNNGVNHKNPTIVEGEPQNTNRVLVDKLLMGDESVLTITDEDRLEAESIREELLQRETLALLQNKKIPDFLHSVIHAIKSDTVTRRLIGIIVWAPKLRDDLIKSDDRQNEMSLLAYGSKFVGKVGDKVELDFTVLVERFTTSYNCWRYTGHDGNGNLIGFLSKHHLESKTTRIKANIKAQEKAKYSGGQTTYLNYVKVLK